MNKKAIIFDNVGVILEEHHKNWSRLIAKHYHLSAAKVYHNYSRKKAWQLFKRGKISETEFWQKGNEAMGLDLNINTLKRLSRQTRKPKPGIVLLLKILKKNYLLGLLNNEGKEWDEYSKRKESFYRYFAFQLASYQGKGAKPEKKIYRELIRNLKRFGLRPADAIYIDDYESNLKPAQALGFQTILFRGIVDLKNQLKKRRIIN